jgi:glycosyltransferase involved in cell wall biosynthesis
MNSTRNNDQPHILMLLENEPYPQDGRVRQEAQSLVNAGYRVSVIAPKAVDQSWKEVINGIQVYRFPAPPDASGVVGYLLEFGYAMAAIFLIAFWIYLKDNFDIIHTHCPPDTFVFIAIFFKMLGKKYVYDHHDLSPEMYCSRFESGTSQFIYQTLIYLEKLSCRFADHIITVNQSYQAVEMERGNTPAKRITIVRNGPDLSLLTSKEPIHNLENNDATIIGYVGVMGVQDGADSLLRALHHLLYDLRRTDFLCVLIGSGEAFPDLIKLSEQLEITNYVRFTGWIAFDKVAHYLNSIDIGVSPEPANPYNNRSTLIKTMEYMAVGIPFVAFDLPETRYTAQEAALYATPNEESDFALKISFLLDNPEQRKEMGGSGKQRIEKALSWPHQEAHLLKAYKAIIEENNEK